MVSPCNCSILNICVPYHHSSHSNRGGISCNVNTIAVVVDNRGGMVALNFKNATALFLIVVPS